MPVVARQDRAQERRHVLTLLLGRDQAWDAGTLGSSEPSTGFYLMGIQFSTEYQPTQTRDQKRNLSWEQFDPSWELRDSWDPLRCSQDRPSLSWDH